MKRNLLNFLVDAMTALAIFGMIATGLLLRFVLPPGSGPRALWEMGRHDWGDVHFWISVGLGALLVVHVALHWQWVCVTVLRFCRRGSGEQMQTSKIKRNLVGIVFIAILIALFAGFVLLARHQVSPAGPGQSHGPPTVGHSEELDENFIRGSMTLGEVAKGCGISVDELKKRMGLPRTVSPEERLGRLCRQYDLTMNQIREIVHSSLKEPGGRTSPRVP